MNMTEQGWADWFDAKLNPFVVKINNQQANLVYLKELQASIGLYALVQAAILTGLAWNPNALVRVTTERTENNAVFCFGIAAIFALIAAAAGEAPSKLLLMTIVEALATLGELNKFLELGQTKISHIQSIETQDLPKNVTVARNEAAAIMTLRACTMLLIITANYRPANLLLTALAGISAIGVIGTTYNQITSFFTPSNSKGSFFTDPFVARAQHGEDRLNSSGPSTPTATH